MKKISLLVLLCMIATLMIGTLSACEVAPHTTHTYGTDWVVTKDNHYHVCTCGAKDAEAAHADANGDEACDVCGITMKHTVHTYGEEWKYDADNHFHLCNKCGEKKDSAAHTDANNDGACDTCAVIMANGHVYASTWSVDSTSHWHAPICGHDVAVKDKANHTANVLGVCEDCHYRVAAPDISTAQKALDVALMAQKAVSSGTYTYAPYIDNADPTDYYAIVTNYEHGDGFFRYIDVDGNKTCYTMNEDGSLFKVYIDAWGSSPSVESKADGKYFAGTEADLSMSGLPNADVQLYGAAQMLNFFAKEYPVLATPEGGTAIDPGLEVADDGYTFSYTVPVDTDVNYIVQGIFTLNAESYAIEKLAVEIVKTDSSVGFMYEQKSTPINLYAPEYVIPTEIEILDNENKKIEFTNNTAATIKLVPCMYKIKISAKAPLNASMAAFGNIEPTVTAMDGSAVDSSVCSVYYDAGSVYVNIKGDGNFKVSIPLGDTTYVVPFEASYNMPTEIVPQYFFVNMMGWDERALVAGELTTYTGDELKLFATVAEGCETNAYTAALTGEANDNVTLTNIGEYDDGMGSSPLTYKFSSTVVGKYTVVFTSTKNAEVTATVTINVLEKPNIKNVAAGKYYLEHNGAKITVNFYTQDAVNNSKGAITVKFDNNGTVSNAVYTYYIKDGEFVATKYSSDANYIVNDLSISNFQLTAQWGRQAPQVLEYQGEADADPGNLPEAPDAPADPDPNAPIPITAGSNMMNVAQIEVTETGTTKYSTAITEAGVAKFSFAFSSSNPSDLWTVTVTIESGDADVNLGGVTTAPYTGNLNYTDWNLALDFTGTAGAEIVFVVTVAEASAT